MLGAYCLKAGNATVNADLLIVGGTESGCAAAVQAARMGVQSIVIVNEIEWLGGQFSAEGLGAIDENRADGYDGTVPIPRSGIFREFYDTIRAVNAAKFNGVASPGNTRVNITALPSDSEQFFRDLLEPYEQADIIDRYSNYYPSAVIMNGAGDRLEGVVFTSTGTPGDTLTVNATVTIDASDWGDVIKLSGAAYEFGPDVRSKYNEPLASTSVFPPTDMNPITYCMILEEQATEVPIAQPSGYNIRDFSVSDWNWIDAEFAYTSRRLVDNKTYPQIAHPDVILINNPNIDYPLDVLPPNVVSALEATETGASSKNIVEMTRDQRKIIFDDAKQRSLRYLYYLQQVLSTSTYNFRKTALSSMFGTSDNLPPKPYVREGLRTKATYMTRQQDTMSFAGEDNYASIMFHDTVLCFEFEYDYHPTARSFHTGPTDGSWHADFRGNRGFGNGGSGRATFPLRSMIPEQIDGLITGQKNLGYSSIVSSALRLHDHSIAIGQATGAAAAVAIDHGVEPRALPFSSNLMADVWSGLLYDSGDAVPAVLWPFADLGPSHSAFSAVNQLAVRQLLGVIPVQENFAADEVPVADWLTYLIEAANRQGYSVPADFFSSTPASRGDAAIALWNHLSVQNEPSWVRLNQTDADLDGILDGDDPLPFSVAASTWEMMDSALDGLPYIIDLSSSTWTGINFTVSGGATVDGFLNDFGQTYDATRGYGWLDDLSTDNRERGIYTETIRDTFVFTRQQDTWQADVDNGWYLVRISVGDSGFDQGPQYVRIEGQDTLINVETSAGFFTENEAIVEVYDGKLTVLIGEPNASSPPQNTTINWLYYVDLKNSDTDLDSINDLWEIQQVSNLTSLGSGDFDRDGSPDVAEAAFLTDPTDANDSLGLDIQSITTSNFTLGWYGRIGVNYQIQWSSDLQSWQRLPDVYSGNDAFINIDIPISAIGDGDETNIFIRLIWVE